MTTPSVTVPVEPIQRLILAADSYGVRYLDSDDMSAEAEELQAATEAMKDLISANAPEGGAVDASAILEMAAKAVEDHQKEGREWIKGSLWDDLTREAAGRIRALKAAPAALQAEQKGGA